MEHSDEQIFLLCIWKELNEPLPAMMANHGKSWQSRQPGLFHHSQQQHQQIPSPSDNFVTVLLKIFYRGFPAGKLSAAVQAQDSCASIYKLLSM